MTLSSLAVAAAAVTIATAVAAEPALAQAAHAPGAPPATLLDVPYVPQTEALCGGAAAAMVMRYWGARDIDARAFAPLVDRDAHGIRTDALVADLRARGWAPMVEDGSARAVQRELALGRPVIALIAAGRGRYHYVVIVSWTPGTLVLHDPARTPFRVVDEKRFDAAWSKAARWMLVLLPPPRLAKSSPESSTPAPVDERDAGACQDEVRAAVRSAEAGDHPSARTGLESAARACPAAAGVWRELAGEDVVDSKWTSAADHAMRALSIDPNDEPSWRILATARYVERQDREALAAWNRVGEPRLDLVNVSGLRRTRYSIAADAIGIATGMPITSAALDLAERRLRDVPAFAAATVSYTPIPNGRGNVQASVVERELAPVSYPAWIGLGLEAAIDRTVTASLASVTGGGDLISASWRWWEHRPMLSASIAAPTPHALGGTWRVEAAREAQTFGFDAREETRVHAGLFAARWIASSMKVGAGLSTEQWRNGPQMMAVSGRVELHDAGDRLVLDSAASVFTGNAAPFQTYDVMAKWRSRTAALQRVWLADAGATLVSDAAPASLWPGAGTGRARPVLLRAHPLLSDGIITGSTFGRRLAFANGEVQQWLRPRRWPLRIAPAAFVDVARASRGFAWNDSRVQIDAGAGLRIALPASGTLRIDLAHGLRDGRTALSAGWTSSW